jgi:hypothetical protein
MDDHNREVLLAIGRVEGKLDGILGAQTRHESRLDKHEARLGGLERWQARVLGMGAAAGAGMSFLLKLIGVH